MKTPQLRCFIAVTLLLLARGLTPAATLTWDGGRPGAAGLWSNRTNWLGSVVPVTGDSLVFPAVTNRSMLNDLASSNYTRLTFNAEGYNLDGNSLRLASGFGLSYALPGSTVVNVGVSLGGNQTWDVSGSSAILELRGPLNFAGFILTNSGAGTIRLAGPVAGSGIWRVRSKGAVEVQGTSTAYAGTVEVSAGEFRVNGRLTGAGITVSGLGTLSGTGVVGPVAINAGGLLSPAGEAGGDGTISTLTVTQALTLVGDARLRMNLNGTTVQNYDQLDVQGTVNLGAGTAGLEVQLGFVPPDGHTFVLLDNDGADAITGTFAGKPEGAVFSVNGLRCRISYLGGTGNDLALTVLGADDLTWTGLGGTGLWSTPGNWNPVRAPQDGDHLVFPGGTPRRLTTNNIIGLDLHSLEFPGTGASNQNFSIAGQAIQVGQGIAVTNPGAATIAVPVVLTAPQTNRVNGGLNFSRSLELNGDLTVAGSQLLQLQNVSGTGRVKFLGANVRLSGTNDNVGGFSALNAAVDYRAMARTRGATGAFVTNTTFQLRADDALVEGLLLHDSVLNVADVQTPSSDPVLFQVDGDLTFVGASRFITGNHLGRGTTVEVTGAVRLNNASLVISNLSVAFAAPVILIRNLGGSPVVGTFSGLPEGAVFIGPGGLQLRISYTGGVAGRDITLTALLPTTGTTRVWSGQGPTPNWSEPANWQALQAPLAGDSLEFANGSRPVNTNNLGLNLINELRFTSPAPLNRILGAGPGSPVALRLAGGLNFQETGTLRVPATNTGFLSFSGLVQIEAPQTFSVNAGGRVTLDLVSALPGAVVTKTGGGTLEVGVNINPFGPGVPFRHQAGTLRVGATQEKIEQLGGTLEIVQQGGDIDLFGGTFDTAPGFAEPGVFLSRLDASGATNPVTIRPGGNGIGHLMVTNGITLNSNVTLRLDLPNSSTGLGLGFFGGTNDLLDFDGTGDFEINGARLELNLPPGFRPAPTNLVLLILSANARTNLGTFAGLPQLGLLTNVLGLFRIYYRDFTLPAPLPNLPFFSGGTNHSSIVLERIAARPIMISVTNGPGAFKTVTALGTPGALYVIEGSDDLIHWTSLSAETASANGRFGFTDAAGLPHRFYRTRIP